MMDMVEAPSCSPHRIQFLESPPREGGEVLARSPFKRYRTSPPRDVTPQIDRKRGRDEGFFVPSTPFNSDTAEKYAPKRQKTEEKMYTLEEVKKIVAQVVADREAALREEFNQTLQTKLEDQFYVFSKFTQDNISRQMKDSDYSYMS